MITAASTVVGRLSFDEQLELVEELRAVVGRGPWITPVAGSLEMSVRIFNAGPVGWVATDARHRHARRHGYHYADRHPMTGEPWPKIPPRWIDLADRFRGPDDLGPLLPWDCAHIVRYLPGAVLGWHRDKTEANLRGRVVTFCLGDDAEWWIEDDNGQKTSTILSTGDVVLLAGPTRNLQHRISRVITPAERSLFNPSPLASPGRIVISMRSGAA